MLSYLRSLLKISRFRFWIYTGGTFVIGYSLGASSFSNFLEINYFMYLLYFFIPANIFIYGVNDYWDQSTDEINPKKEDKEFKLRNKDRRFLRNTLIVVLLISVILLFFQKGVLQRITFLSFLLLSYFYSAEPLRFKSKPFLDFSSNMLYIMPGIFGYVLVTDNLPPLIIILAAFGHISAMHIFSAIPDIKYDKKAGITTTAVYLGYKKSLLLCIFFWSLLAGITLLMSNFHPLSFLVLIYPIIPFFTLVNEQIKIEKIYWSLPYINTSLGGLLFIMLVIYNLNII